MPVPRPKNIILVRPEVDQNKVDRQLACAILNQGFVCNLAKVASAKEQDRAAILMFRIC